MTAPTEPAECDHDWTVVDDSFDHEFGTEKIHYYECEHCGATKDLEPGDYCDPFEDF